MGCWNTTCGVSNLPIHYGEEVVVFLLTRNKHSFMENFVHIDTYFKPCLLPFYGFYNDYGSVEDCYGAGLPVLIEAVRSKLTEIPLGENPFHDIPAIREELDVEKLFELDHEDRLFISPGTNGDSTNWGLKTVHVQIKRSVFDYILENWSFETYVGEEYKPQTFKFQDAYSDLEEFYKKLPADPLLASFMIRGMNNLSTNILHESLESPLLGVSKIAVMPNAKELLLEALKGGFINWFMDAIRKPWVKPIGNGSQNTDLAPYRVLMDAMTHAMNSETDGDDNDET